jgi:hypothetical protein
LSNRQAPTRRPPDSLPRAFDCAASNIESRRRLRKLTYLIRSYSMLLDDLVVAEDDARAIACVDDLAQVAREIVAVKRDMQTALDVLSGKGETDEAKAGPGNKDKAP